MRHNPAKPKKTYALLLSLVILLVTAGIVAVGGAENKTRPSPADIVILDCSGAMGANVGAIDALRAFTDAVAEKADPDGEPGTGDELPHRIAVAGAGANKFQDMSTAEGRDMAAAAVNTLGTPTAGRTMAEVGGVFAHNPLPAGETRYRVVLVLSDGDPAAGSDAAAEIAAAEEIKTTHGAAVYAVGLFDGADPASAGAETGAQTERQNWFLQNLSSNDGDPPAEDGGPSYYLSAGDGAALTAIFQNIAAFLDQGAGTAPPAEAPVTVNFTNVAPFRHSPDQNRLRPLNARAKSLGMRSLGAPMFAPMAAVAGDGDDGDDILNAGLQLNKWVETNDDGTYTVNLEAYTTGKVLPGLKNPIDFVFIADQSGSMEDEMPAFKPAYIDDDSSKDTETLDPEMMYFMRVVTAEELTYLPVVCDTASDKWLVASTGQLIVPMTSVSDTDPSHVQLWTYFKKLKKSDSPDTSSIYYILHSSNGYLPVRYFSGETAPESGAGWYVINPQNNPVVSGTPLDPAGTQFFENTTDKRLEVLKRVVTIFAATARLKSIGLDGVCGPYAYCDGGHPQPGFISNETPYLAVYKSALDKTKPYHVKQDGNYKQVDYYKKGVLYSEKALTWQEDSGWYVDQGETIIPRFTRMLPKIKFTDPEHTQFYYKESYYIKDISVTNGDTPGYRLVEWRTMADSGIDKAGWYVNTGTAIDPYYGKKTPKTRGGTGTDDVQFYTRPAYPGDQEPVARDATYYIEGDAATGAYQVVKYYTSDPNGGSNGAGWYVDQGPFASGSRYVRQVPKQKDGTGGVQFYDDDEVHHRIAIVGFATSNDIYSGFQNTELFIGENYYNYGDIELSSDYAAGSWLSPSTGSLAKDYYDEAFQDLSTPQGFANVQSSIAKLDAKGATATHKGLEMAQGILEAYTDKDDVPAGGRMAILFTDGVPGLSGNFDTTDLKNVAVPAVTIANKIKENADTVIYTVGIFGGADATKFPAFKNPATTPYGKTEIISNGNRFMHEVSSNFLYYNPDLSGGEGMYNIDPFPPEDIHKDVSYYLSAGDELALMQVFAGIVAQIQFAAPDAAHGVGETMYVDDEVTKYFSLPTNANDIKVRQIDCQSYDEDTGAAVWDSKAEPLVTPVYSFFDTQKTYYIRRSELEHHYTYKQVTYDSGQWKMVDEDSEVVIPKDDAGDLDSTHTQFYAEVAPEIIENHVIVKDFDFKHNYVTELGRNEDRPDRAGTFYGRKLTISFTVTPRDDFLGGANVPTNTPGSGVYEQESDDSSKLAATFPVPTVDVPIKDISVTAEDKHVYLRNTLTLVNMKTAATAEIGDSVTLKLDQDGYGLDGNWQYDLANITVGLQDKSGADISGVGLTSLEDDSSYKVSVTVAPKENYEKVYDDDNPLNKDDTYYILKFTLLNEGGDSYEYEYQKVKWYKASESPSPTKEEGWYCVNDGSYVKKIPRTSSTDPTHEQFYAQGNSSVLEQTGESTAAAINVFKPALTFKDSKVWYGDAAPANPAGYNSDNKVGDAVWKHDTTLSTGVTMTGTKPTLTLAYTPAEDKIKDDQIASKADVPVQVTVQIGAADVTDETTFVHEACPVTGCTWSDPTTKGDPAFLLHPQTCALTIAKTGGKAGEPYVFTILKDGVKYTEAHITGNDSVTIKELPVGQYTVAENTNWSWRYKPSSIIIKYGTDDTATGLELGAAASQAQGTATCENPADRNARWLNGYSGVKINIYKEGGGA